MNDVAAKLRARAEKARVVRDDMGVDPHTRARFAFRSEALVEAASLVESSQEARVEWLAEKWLTRADHIDGANKPTDSNETRLIAVTKAGTLRDCARALSARLCEPASTESAPAVREEAALLRAILDGPWLRDHDHDHSCMAASLYDEDEMWGVPPEQRDRRCTCGYELRQRIEAASTRVDANLEGRDHQVRGAGSSDVAGTSGLTRPAGNAAVEIETGPPSEVREAALRMKYALRDDPAIGSEALARDIEVVVGYVLNGPAEDARAVLKDAD